MTTEAWADVVGYEGLYMISTRGRVLSLPRMVDRSGTPVWLPGRLLKQALSKGYPTVKLSKDGKARTGHVHLLVLEAFVGPRPPGQQACHWNDVPDDNRLENLRWSTENARDCVRNGHHHGANKTHCKHGHEYTPENTAMYGGARSCRECYRAKNRAAYRRRGPMSQGDREHALELQREYRERNREAITVRRAQRKAERSPAPRNGSRWTALEDATIRRDDLSVADQASMLGRSYAAVTYRRRQLENPEGVAEARRREQERAESVSLPIRSRAAWTPDDDAVLFRSGMTDVERAALLGRSYSSIKNRRVALRKRAA